MTFFFGLHLILGGSLDVERRDHLFFFDLHLILGGKLDVAFGGDSHEVVRDRPLGTG